MAILLDTNVVSEMINKVPDPSVDAWISSQPIKHLFFSAVGEAELRYGAAVMEPGSRQRKLLADIEHLLNKTLQTWILPFDRDASRIYADILAMRKTAGRPIKAIDGQIAAIARMHNMAVATRNVRDFEETGVQIVNPWETTWAVHDS